MTEVRKFIALLRNSVKANSLVIGISLLFFAASIPFSLHFDRTIGLSFWPYLTNIVFLVLPIVGVGSIAIRLIYLMFIERAASPTQALFQYYKPLVTDLRRWAKAIPTIFFMLIAFNAFTEMKSLIPKINPYSWDIVFMEMDRVLHFGTDPWRLLEPVFGNSFATLIINFNYNIWFAIMFVFWVWAATTAEDQGWERQFLVSFLLTWIIGGVVFATVFSSMGPVYYDLIDPLNNPYSAQMEMLRKIDETSSVWALATQDMLRDAYLSPDPSKLSGISAMPSMHVATSTLFMLAGFKIHKKLGYALLVFWILLVIGSVHLAWHYAVDAYAGIIIAILMWKLSIFLIARQDKLWPLEKVPT